MKEKRRQAIRPDRKGKVDDVAISGDLFRLERMSNSVWWVCIYRGKKRTAFYLERPRGKKTVEATLIEDSIGCIDDSKD